MNGTSEFMYAGGGVLFGGLVVGLPMYFVMRKKHMAVMDEAKTKSDEQLKQLLEKNKTINPKAVADSFIKQFCDTDSVKEGAFAELFKVTQDQCNIKNNKQAVCAAGAFDYFMNGQFARWQHPETAFA